VCHNPRMSRKWLQNVADNLCQIFCGWRLIGSKPILVELGSGTIEINVLKSHAMFSGRPIRHLPIASELSRWLHKELLAQKILPTEILHATLRARLAFEKVSWNKKTQELFFANGKAVTTKRMHRCSFFCEGEVATAGKVYRSRLEEVQEWPVGWPRQGTSLSWTKFPK